MKKIIIIRRIIKKNEKKKRIKVGCRDGRTVETNWREREGENDFFSFYFLLVSFSDLRKSDHRLSSEQKAKLVYAKRATHRYQYLSLWSNVKI